MDSLQFMKAIGLPEYAIAALERIALTEAEIEGLPRADFLDEPYRGDRPDYVLALFVGYLSKHSEEAYRKRGVMREEWLATMSDLAIWCKQLFGESGEVGLRETHWLAHLVRTEIFRLGRLQFVPRVLSEELRCGGNGFPVGTRYCEVHIPAEGRLLPALVRASFARAKQLFAPKLFTCESWLLSPKLKGLLSGGNILDFASRFQVVSVDEADRSAERYIFGKISNPSEYLPANVFSARVRDMAREGNFVGSAYGICFAEDL
ncbi:MAG: acyltransferase domain-containing protein [Clostridia bacterium]|nr:acyltransferase domain-containing protein [Clostridia bacterium]